MLGPLQHNGDLQHTTVVTDTSSSLENGIRDLVFCLLLQS